MHAGVSDHAGSARARADAPARMAFRHSNDVGTRDNRPFAAPWPACTLPYRRFAGTLAGTSARLGADVGRYSFIAVDLHHLLLAGLPAHYWWRIGQATRAAKREVRVVARGIAWNQAARRSRLSAAAVATCCRWVLAKPR